MKQTYRNLYKSGKWVIAVVFMFSSLSCDDYLDVVPDNVSTIDHAFKLRNEAEKYLFTCYSFLPRNGEARFNIGMLSGDELWIPFEKGYQSFGFYIARGNQRTSEPYMNAWYGNYHGGGPGDRYGLFMGIRHCNTFIENISDPSKAPDLTSVERERWLGEAQFLKAYYHYYLLRMYGPIPIIDENLPIDAPESEVNVKRNSVNECTDYIVGLLDKAAPKLPLIITDRTTELGRITRPIALAVKAKVLLMAASPLFNGNEDFADFKDHDGKLLFDPGYDQSKWNAAADAALEAIQVAEEAGHSLFEFTGGGTINLPDTLRTELSIRQAICERWNEEIIWGNPNSTTWELQQISMAPLAVEHNHNNARKLLSPPLKIARMFYTKNGVPIDEDKTLDFRNENAARVAEYGERFYIHEGYETARLNFDREPRFYANLCFDGGKWYKYDNLASSGEPSVLRAKLSDYGGSAHSMNYNETGYYVKKLVDWNQTISSTGASYKEYPWPEIRLADLYLMYAEALNEASGPSETVYEYLDKVRERAGLAGVKTSWENFSANPTKYTTQEGLREIIHRERLIELAFEGNRFWDLLRWKKASEKLNEPITGWNIFGDNFGSYYQIRTIYQQKFVAPRDYFWPIAENTIIQNPNLVQNPGW